MPENEPIEIIRPASYRLAIRDITQGVLDWPRWSTLALFQIKKSFWRTRLGVLWQMLSFALTISAIGILFSTLMDRPWQDFIPHFGLGFACWTFINAAVGDSAQIYEGNAGLIKEFPLPYSFYAFSSVAKALMLFAMNIVCLLPLLIYLGEFPSWQLVMVLPGLLIYIINALFLMLILGPLVVRFRDLRPLIANIMRVAFFLTPVMWTPDLRPSLVHFVQYNPLFHYVEVVRAPMRGEIPELITYYAVAGCSFFIIGLCLLSFRMNTARLRQWL